MISAWCKNMCSLKLCNSRFIVCFFVCYLKKNVELQHYKEIKKIEYTELCTEHISSGVDRGLSRVKPVQTRD